MTHTQKTNFVDPLTVAKLASYLGIVVGVLVISGWLFNISFLKNVLPGLTSMKFNTALSILLAALSLHTYLMGRQRLSLSLAAAVVLIVGLSLAQYIFNQNYGIDQFIVTDPDTPTSLHPGRMSQGTGVGLILLGLALMLLNTTRWQRYSEVLAMLLTVMIYPELIGSLYNVQGLYDMPFFSSIALHTTLSLIMLGTAVGLANPHSILSNLLNDPNIKGMIARRLLPTITIVPILLGWLVLVGQQSGIYDTTMRLSLLVTATIFVFAFFVWWIAKEVNAVDQERKQSVDKLQRINRAYRILSSCNQALIRATNENDLMETICNNITYDPVYSCAEVMYTTRDQDNSLYLTHRVQACSEGYTAPTFEENHALIDLTLQSQSPQIQQIEQQAMIILPVTSKSNVYGVLAIYSLEPDYTEQEIALFDELARDLAFGIMTLREREAFKQADERIQYQAHLLANVQDAIIATTIDYRINSWNTAAEYVYGWSEQEVIGRSINEFLKTTYLNDQDQAAAMHAMQKHGTWQGEVLQSTRDGRQINILSSVSALRDSKEKMVGMVAVNRDMSFIRELERSNLRYVEQFQTLFDQSLDVLLVVSAQDGTIIEVNEAAKRVLGYEPDHLTDQHFSMLFPPEVERPPDDLLEQIKVYNEVFASQEFLKHDGTICEMDLTAGIVSWDDGQAVLVTLRDVTERRQMEKQRIETEIMREKLRQERELLDLKEQFIAMVTHEFRTPLTVIMSSNQILVRYRHKLSDERRDGHHEKIHNYGTYMTELLDDVLLFTRIRSGTNQPELQPLPLESFCSELFEEIEQSQVNDNVRMIFETRLTTHKMMMDEKLLRLVVINLLSNAVKYSPDGGEVRMQLYDEPGFIVIKISDQGIGIPEKDQSRLFQPFQRASNTGSIDGTGLGLAITYETVNSLGGSLTFESAEGEGTTFWARLPINKASP